MSSAFNKAKNNKSEHVERSQRSDLWKTDVGGWKPKCVLKAMSVESPARTMNEAREDQAKLEAERQSLSQEKDAKIEFFDKGNHIMGNIYAASGFKRLVCNERSQSTGP
ncbi:hypothetical protein H9Q72_012645 [Fusarium xylarioides]|uniref:Uncharacterized protein n=1 Tax=Fusarium xylarioides TaxID=221167 RepID=A0A9P7L2Y6_9HYPO|nr:hypothetical protein H9Q72_012645 [Fusarium xylarioides]